MIKLKGCNDSRLTVLAIFCLAVIALVYIYTIFTIYNFKITTDFRDVYLSGKSLLVLKNPYILPVLDLKTNQAVFQISQNLAGPFTTLVGALLGKILTRSDGFLAWSLISIVFLFVGCKICNDQLLNLEKRTYKHLLGMCFVLSLPFVYGNIFYGQCTMYIFFFLSLGLVFMKKKLDLPAGLCLAIVTNIKFFFLFLLVYMVAKKAYKLMTFYIIFSLALAILPMASNLKGIINTYVLVLQAINWYGSNWNASLQGFFVRLLGRENNYMISIFYLPNLAATLYFITAFIYTALAFFAIRRCKNTNLCVAITLSTMLLVSPLGGIYYYITFYMPFISTLQLCKQRSPLLVFLLYLSLFLACLAPPYLTLKSFDASYLFFTANISFFSLFIFTNLCLYLAYTFEQNPTNQAEVKSTKGYIAITLIISYISLFYIGHRYWNPKRTQFPFKYSYEQSTLDKLFLASRHENNITAEKQ